MTEVVESRGSEIGALSATGFVSLATTGVMASSGEGPHVVQLPDHRFVQPGQMLQAVEGKEPLVEPMEVKDIRFPDPGVLVDPFAPLVM